MRETVTVNGREYRLIRLLGHGKGGYSYLAEESGNQYVVKRIHHEPCDYYSFGNKIEAELRDYERLLQAGIRMPLMIGWDRDAEIIVKQYIAGETVSEALEQGKSVEEYLPQVRQMARQAYENGLNIDYFPTNFVISDGKLWYIDYECNEYMSEWNFENWGRKYWSRSEEFEAWLKQQRDGKMEEERITVAVETVRNDEFEMRYVHFGTRGKRPFVLLPGLSIQSVMGSAQAIAKQYAVFEEDFEVFVMDRREAVPADYTVYQMAEDTAIALRQLRVEDACLMGVSQGGMMAQLIAINHPELVGKLVLCSTAPYVPAASAARMQQWLQLAQQFKREELCLAFGEAVYSPPLFEAYRPYFLSMAQSITMEDLARFTVMARATEGFDARNELNRIACPVLVIGAGKDKMFAREVSCQLADLTRGELFIYENGAHAAYDEEPDYPERVHDFLIR
ncbi:MAG: alpha/beta fold hydrolase [Erysipelotrichaceae bacterium]|nr:alpha/beta fold hydrolase [Erysipelotrichaceae bacterium]